MILLQRLKFGEYVGYTLGFQILGNALGALCGALLTSTWFRKIIFSFLSIGSGTCAIFSTLFFSETKCTLVGNGSVTPEH